MRCFLGCHPHTVFGEGYFDLPYSRWSAPAVIVLAATAGGDGVALKEKAQLAVVSATAAADGNGGGGGGDVVAAGVTEMARARGLHVGRETLPNTWPLEARRNYENRNGRCLSHLCEKGPKTTKAA